MSSELIYNQIQQLRQHEPFKQMDEQHLLYLVKRAEQCFYAVGEPIISAGSGVARHLYIIKQGSVRGVSAQKNGTTQELWHLTEAELFPLGALLGNRSVTMSFVAAEDCFCLRIKQQDFDTIRHNSPPFDDFCSRRMASLLDRTLQLMQQQSAQEITGQNRFQLPLRDLPLRHPVTVTETTSIQQALTIMDAEKIGSIITTSPTGEPSGMLTRRDFISRIILPQTDIQQPVSTVATPNLITLTIENSVADAMLEMARHGINHIPLRNQQGQLSAIVSERDIFALQQIGVVQLSQAIASAQTINELQQHPASMQHLVMQMVAEGASVAQLTSMISTLNDRLTQRVIEIIVRDYPQSLPPFSWLSFGSEGRSEQTLHSDQDNGILFEANDADCEAVRQQLLPFALQVNQALAECGFRLCPGNIMASNPQCCLSTDEWRNRFARWIGQGTPEHLLAATIFFDMRCLYGDEAPVDSLQQFLLDNSHNNSRFAHLLTGLALTHRPPLGVWRDFVVTGRKDEHPNSLHIKRDGITPFVDAARIYALMHQIPHTNTAQRFTALAEKGLLHKKDVTTWLDSYHFVQLMRLQLHRQQYQQQQPLSNYLNPDSLHDLDRRILKEAFRQGRKLQSRLTLDFIH